MTEAIDDSSNPGYANAAGKYWAAGWRGVLPLPAGRKFPPPGNKEIHYTGYGAATPSWPDIQTWIETIPGGNVALRLPDGVIGIDVDAYDGKTGSATLWMAQEKWGELPRTYRSTSRTDDYSGIYLFRVPVGAKLVGKIDFPDMALGHIEIVQAHHRYCVVWPSLHPEGGRYRWIAPDGFVSDEVPSIEELPELPTAWLNALTGPAMRVSEAEVAANAGARIPTTDGMESPRVTAIVDEAANSIHGAGNHDSRHDIALAATGRLVRAAEQGEQGVGLGLARLRHAFVSAITDRVSADEAEREFERMADGTRIHALIAATPTAQVEVFDIDRDEVLRQAEILGKSTPPEGGDDTEMSSGPGVSTGAATTQDASPSRSQYIEPPTSLTMWRERARTHDLDDMLISFLDEVQLVDGEFWSARESLSAIYASAMKGMAAPWAVFGQTIARALAATPPWVKLPALGGYGRKGSLNSFIAIVGRSGAGKDISAGIAELLVPKDVFRTEPASGQSLAHIYATKRKEQGQWVQDRIRNEAIVDIPEVESLTAKGAQQGSTLHAALRYAFSGQRLGAIAADGTRSIDIEAESYRLSLVVGVQPECGDGILNQAGGGTPQRFVWLPASDRRIAADPESIIQPEPFYMATFSHGEHVMSLPQVAADEITDARRANLMGEGDPLRSHLLYAREKFAAALALIDGRFDISASDWELSGIVQQVSDMTRAFVEAKVEQAAAVTASREGTLAGVRLEAARAEQLHQEQQRSERMVELVNGKLGAEWAPVHQIRRAITSRDRRLFQPAVGALIAQGIAELSPDGKAVRRCGI